MLKVEGINLRKDSRQIIRDVSYEVHDGEIFSILGANGAGKSSLAFALIGSPDYRPDRGRILFDGVDITDLGIDERARMGITLAWQEPARFEGIPVLDFVLLGTGGGERPAAEEMLEQVRLAPAEYCERKVDKTLSGGERKKIELASILAMNPKLAILDEPDSGIDMLSQDAVIGTIRRIRDDGGSVILITHEEDVVRIADRAALMCSGMAFRIGDPGEIIEYYRHRCRPCPTKEYPSSNDADATNRDR